MWQRALWLLPMLLHAEDVAVSVASGYISDIQPTSFLLKTVAKKEFRCTYDHRTWFEQSRVRVPLKSFLPSDLVEIVADRRLSDATPCYVRTVRLADLSKKESGRMRITYRGVTELMFPRGEYQWAGMVRELTRDHMILRTRKDGYKTIALRNDTRYFEDGVVSEWERLRPNTRVSIRAGRNFEGKVEVYQIIWGAVTPH